MFNQCTRREALVHTAVLPSLGGLNCVWDQLGVLLPFASNSPLVGVANDFTHALGSLGNSVAKAIRFRMKGIFFTGAQLPLLPGATNRALDSLAVAGKRTSLSIDPPNTVSASIEVVTNKMVERIISKVSQDPTIKNKITYALSITRNVTNSPEILSGILKKEVLPRVLEEVNRLLPSLIRTLSLISRDSLDVVVRRAQENDPNLFDELTSNEGRVQKICSSLNMIDDTIRKLEASFDGMGWLESSFCEGGSDPILLDYLVEERSILREQLNNAVTGISYEKRLKSGTV